MAAVSHTHRVRVADDSSRTMGRGVRATSILRTCGEKEGLRVCLVLAYEYGCEGACDCWFGW